MNFKDLNIDKDILKALEIIDYKRATKVQEKVIKELKNNKDLIVKSKTGSGKTAAFLIPICEKMKIESKNPKALIITPTRELCIQIQKEANMIGRLKRLKTVALLGGRPLNIQINELKQRVHIVCATPGRALEHIRLNTLNLEDIEYLVIDEADEMLSLGFMDQVKDIISKLKKQRRTMLFSATIEKELEEVCKDIMIDPIRIDIQDKVKKNNIEEVFYKIKEEEKIKALKNIIYTKKIKKAIIFCNRRDKVDEILRKLQREELHILGLHGGMSQDLRTNNILDFKKNLAHFLIATDVASRGIHVDDISHVINYDFPEDKENYVHRIGRTGRYKSKGMALSFITTDDNQMLNEVKDSYNIKVKYENLPDKDKVKRAKKEFERFLKTKPKMKRDISHKLNKDIMKIRINCGKNKKIRNIDIVGMLFNIKDIKKDDIGIIEVQTTCSYVEIFNNKGDLVLNNLKNMKLKGKSFTFKKISK